MNLLKRRVLSAAAAAAMLFSASSSAIAAKDINTLKGEMQSRSEELKKMQREIDEKQGELSEQEKKKTSLDLQITALMEDIDSTEALVDKKQAQIDEASAKIDELSGKIEENKEQLKERLRVMYEYGTTSYLDIILEAKGLSDLFTRVSVVKDIIEHDNTLINQYVSSKNEVEQAKSELVEEKKEQEESLALLSNKKSALQTAKNEREAVIAELEGDIEEMKRREEQQEKDYNAIQAELNAALKAEEAKKTAAKKSGTNTANTASYSGGIFAWPSATSTRITSKYGYRNHPITGTYKLHRGVDIGASAGTDVLAAEAGTVLTAGWSNSYGNYVTISHGNGYVTLYAHNSKLLVSKGDTVTRGQAIAKVGSTGSSTAPHIHFEVQKNGQLQDPMNFF